MSENLIVPKSPDSMWLHSYFQEQLVAAKAYKIDAPQVQVKLDQNESPWDWTDELKDEVLLRVKTSDWNRYPEPQGTALNKLLADYVNVPESCILTSPGSNYMIPLVFDAMGRRLKGKFVVARPSFSLFEMHCHYAGIPYETWDLDDSFRYDLNKLPKLTKGSLVVFASPNNPTGSQLSYEDLNSLLAENPDSMFLADEAYFEFGHSRYVELLGKHDNLMILRTMSKTLGAAGVRFGYLVGSEPLLQELKKLRLPFLLNHFSMQAIQVLLSDPRAKAAADQHITHIKTERDRVFKHLESLGEKSEFQVFPSEANFLLLRWHNQERCQSVYKGLIDHGVLVRNISSGPMLEGCLRASLGTTSENDRFLSAMDASA